MGGGIRETASSGVREDLVICNNTADEGGGISCETDLDLVGCTIAGNSARQGGGIHSVPDVDPHISMERCIIWFNEAASEPDGHQIYTSDFGSLVRFTCCSVDSAGVTGAGTADYVSGTLFIEPRFCDPGAGEYTLASNSPCLPGNHPTGDPCGLIGALGQGCEPIHMNYLIHADGSGDCPTIQAGIETAIPGDTLELSDGTFIGDGNRDVSFLGKAVTLRSQSGDPNACVVDVGGSEQEPHRGFIFENHEGRGSVLQGLKIINGYATGEWPGSHGGGVLCIEDTTSCQGPAPTIANCVFESNHADNSGGGIMCRRASPLISNCVFDGNSAMYGGGLYYYRTDGDFMPTAELVGCLFEGNYASSLGGGMVVSRVSTVSGSGCTFVNNACPGLGGGVHILDAHLDQSNSIIAFSSEGAAMTFDATGSASHYCCDIFGNAGGDWVGYIGDQLGIDGNLSVDPIFCDDGSADPYTLRSDSPCLPGNHPRGDDCGTIGARGQGCVCDPPEAATNCSASDDWCDGVLLTWVDNSIEETGFKVIREDSVLAVTGANIVEYADTTAAAEESQMYVIVATGVCGDAVPSNQDDGRRLQEPMSPDSLVIANIEIEGDSLEVELRWCDNSMDEEHQVVYLVVDTQLEEVTTVPADSVSAIFRCERPEINEVCFAIAAVNCETEALSEPVCDSALPVDDASVAIPMRYSFGPAHPNPFNPSVTISFATPREAACQVTIYDVSGRRVAILSDGVLPAGWHAVRWDGKDDGGQPVTSGIYFVQMRAGAFRQVIRLVLLK